MRYLHILIEPVEDDAPQRKNYPAHICYALDTEQMTRKEAERIFRIPYSTICDIFRRFNENGGVVQYPRGHVPKPHVLSQEPHVVPNKAVLYL
jgi:transposase